MVDVTKSTRGPAAGFEVRFVVEDGTQCQLPWTDAWAVRFESAAPARRFTSYRGQRHFPGRWWTATMGRHVGFESWLERDHLMLLDFDPSVVGVSSQPYWLTWTDEEGGARAHVPDFFARRDDGSALVVDCRPVQRRKAADLAVFGVIRQVCQLLGWEYRLVGAPDVITTANVRWLAGYRHPRHSRPGLSDALRAVFAKPTPLMVGA
ncbi:TnsA-like heteromeric transposase endonuclease subunit [Dactylosporangium sp. CA-139114]|uniref:TnsA-like heteromeric transposase endonuclease subunit n=1 Tax=Dactylosporangium sp. CA-139114 TaxID=3239931 RepID=UPI003D98C33F